MLKPMTLGVATAILIGMSGATSADTRKLGQALTHIHTKATAQTRIDSSPGLARSTRSPADELFVAPMTADGYVVIDAVAAGDTADLAATIENLGGRNVASYHRTVSAQFPAAKLGELAASAHLAFAQPALATTNAGVVDGQADRSMGSDVARQRFDVDGSGLTVGILSDSFSCASSNTAGGPFTTTEQDIVSGELPPDPVILDDIDTDPACIDEGRAMAQLMFDILPGTKIAFHTAFGGQANFAEGIVELAEAGADVIVDDVIYFLEPMFQDGIIAQAADEVARLGIPYYSSNGNRGRDAFQSEYRAVTADLDGGAKTWHDFDAGPGVDPLKTVTLDGALQTNLIFNWDNPNFSVSGAPGAQTDVDVVMFDANGERVADCFPGGVFEFPANGLCQFQFTDGGGPIDGGGGGDAIEYLSLVDFIGGSTIQLGFLTEEGVAPGFVKYVIFQGGYTSTEYDVNAPSGYGHNNAAGAEGVGASGFFYTEAFIDDPQTRQLRQEAGLPPCEPACLNDFSSAGGTPIFFDTDGNRLPQAEIRLKPGLTAPDGTNTTFFRVDTFRDDDDFDGVFDTNEEGEFPNFFGTSAAAPHAAAVAALLVDAEGSQVKTRSGRFRMCQPDDDDDEGRDDGEDRRVRADQVRDRIDRGWLLGPCDRTEPQAIYDVMRKTAKDMSIRADLTTGETLQVFEEVGSSGFDFDSGFGFIDAVGALEAFTDDDDDDDDDDDNDDEDDD